jgi:hypothetical protein
MKYYFTVIIILLTSIQLYSQKSGLSSDTLVVYFGNNTFDLTNTSKNYINNKVSEILKESCDSVHIMLNGYTDKNGPENYNIVLAKKRLLQVEKIISENPQFKIDNNFPYAESGNRLSTMSKNRRVEIIFKCEHIHKNSTDLTKKEAPVKDKPIKIYQDSTIIYPSGMQIVLKKELVASLDTSNAFSKFEIIDQSLNNPNTISGYTQDENGNPLASAGMFDIISENRFGEDTCMSTPITVRFPIRNDGCYKPLYILPWKRNKNGAWEETDTFKIDTVNIQGVEYFETQITCPGKNNMDAKLSRFKIKLKGREISKNFVLDSAIITNDCKTMKLRGLSKNGKKIKVIVPCNFQQLNIQYYFHNKDSNLPFTSEEIKINSHNKGLGYRFCKVEKRNSGKFRRQLIWPKLRTYSIIFNQLIEL